MFAWLKVFPEVFKGMIEGLEKLQNMSGGNKRGQIVFWSGFILGFVLILIFISWAVGPAYESISAVLSHFNINLTQVNINIPNIPASLFLNLLLAILLTLAYLAVLVGLSAIIGALLGTFTSAVFAPNTTGRIDKMFSEIIPLLENLEEESKSDIGKQLLVDANGAYTLWNKSLMTKVSRWLGRLGKKPKKGSKT